MGAQNVTTGGTGSPKTIMTLVATGAISDFFSDPRIIALKNRPRDERFIFVIVFFVGGVIAAFAYRYSSPMLALILCGVFKLISAFVVLFAPDNRKGKEQLPTDITQAQKREVSGELPAP